MKPFDNYEIHGCAEHNAGTPDAFTEQCPDSEAQFWTLYGHIPGEGVEAIGDFTTRKDAEEMFQRITGIPFGTHEEVEARVRVMHAAPKLLDSLKTLAEHADEDCPHGYRSRHLVEALEDAQEAVAEATGRAA